MKAVVVKRTRGVPVKFKNLEGLLDDEPKRKATVNPAIVIDSQIWADFKAALEFLNKINKSNLYTNTVMERLTLDFIDWVEAVAIEKRGTAGGFEYKQHMKEARARDPEDIIKKGRPPKAKADTSTLVYSKKKGPRHRTEDDDD